MNECLMGLALIYDLGLSVLNGAEKAEEGFIVVPSC